MTLIQKREALVAQYEQSAGSGSATELLSQAAQAKIATLNARAAEIGNTKVFKKWISRLEQSGLSEIEATDVLQEALIKQFQAKRPAAPTAPRSVGVPIVVKASSETTTATPAPAIGNYPKLAEYERLRGSGDSRAAGDFYAENATQICREDGQRTKLNRADFRAQQKLALSKKY